MSSEFENFILKDVLEAVIANYCKVNDAVSVNNTHNEVSGIANANTTRSYYDVTINGTTVDIYDILTAYKVTDHAVAHAIKKLLRLGKGHKDVATDINEAIASLKRALHE